MTNPAELLLNLFHSWNSTSETPRESRNDEDLIDHFLAVKYLNEIEEALRRCEALGRSAEIPMTYLPTWKHIIFNYPRSWNQVSDSSLDPVALQMLQFTASFIGDVCPPVPEDALAQLARFLDTVYKALREDASLPDKINLSVRVVLDQLRTCVDNLTVSSSFEIQDALYRLLGALLIALSNSTNKNRWSDLIKNFATGWITNQVPALPTQEILQALGS